MSREETAPSHAVRVGLALLLAGTFALMLWHGFARPDAGRFWDERYSFANVRVLLNPDMEGGPANAYYPSLSYLPQTVVFWVSETLSRWTGLEGLSVFEPEVSDGWSATAYRLARGVSALFGVLAVFWTYRVGRRLFGDARVGLLGAAAFAATPALIQASAIFKPDVLVAWLVLVTFLWSLDAVETPTRGRYARVGVGVGLTVAAKYTGVGAAIPITLGTLLSAPTERRRWLWLVGAGAVSVVTFVVLNPHVVTIVSYIPRLFEIAEGKSEMEGGSHALALVHQARFLWRHHGPVVLGFTVAGLVGLARRSRSSVQAGMALGFVVGYSLLYAAVIEAFRGQNYVPVAAFTSLAAGWAAVGLWDRLAERLPGSDHRAVAVAATVAVVLAVFVHPVTWVYGQVTPTTWERAARLLVAELKPVAEKHLIFEKRDDRLQVFYRGQRMASTAVTHLGQVSDDELARADALVFPAEALEGPDAGFYLKLLAAGGGDAQRLEPELLRLQGEPLVVLIRHWQRLGEPAELPVTRTGERSFQVPAPAPAGSGELWSLRVRMPRERNRRRPATVHLGDVRVPLLVTRISGRRGHFLTPRFEPPGPLAEGSSLELVFDRDPGDLFLPEVTLLRWRRGSALDSRR